MLQLKNIRKVYRTGDLVQTALDGVSVNFRRSEFVAILGPSGSGKTTLLNIIGGLDRYDEGAMEINGVSTAAYRDGDWDTYRNHSIGFVFQSYNLIPHQTVLSNVELALTLSGVSKAERRARAKQALEQVGLGDQIHKKPNQMSGGQMQGVAIARALVNDPDILLADEPTGALDSDTSVQIMEILRNISKDRLIVMVTHNPDLAEEYANRIIRLRDGAIIDDTNPCTDEEARGDIRTEETVKKGKRSMTMATALSLSLNNLLTKKTRTFLTAFAGSIGIIGIALILSLSNGIQNYIDRVQEDTLSSYPIELKAEESDYSAVFGAMMGSAEEIASRDTTGNTIYVDDSMGSLVSAMSATVKNDLSKFKTFLESHDVELEGALNNVSYVYPLTLPIYSADGKTAINPTSIFENMGESMSAMFGAMQGTGGAEMMSAMFNVFSEMQDNEDLLHEQYDVVAGQWPTAANEVVLVLDENNQISNMVLYVLGIKDQSDLPEIMEGLMKEQEYDSASDETYNYEDFLGLTFRLLYPEEYYRETDRSYTVDGKSYPIWEDMRAAEDFDSAAFAASHGEELKVVGILRPDPQAVSTSITGAIGYRSDLTHKVLARNNATAILQQQKATPDHDVLTGLTFEKKEYTTANVEEFLETLTAEEKQTILMYLNAMTGGGMTVEMLPMALSSMEEADYAKFVANFVKDTKATYDGNLALLGGVDEGSPIAIRLYAKDFESKDTLEAFIADYNAQVPEEDRIQYTDMVGILMSSVTTIVDIISYVLIAFVSISLVVSSIMIGIITYISVLERTKEIGILRSIGASKKDVSRVFNAETLIEGFASGVIGILMTLLLNIPASLIVQSLTDIAGIATLPLVGGVVLVIISMVLTLIAGVIPARMAAKKDVVIALRTE